MRHAPSPAGLARERAVPVALRLGLALLLATACARAGSAAAPDASREASTSNVPAAPATPVTAEPRSDAPPTEGDLIVEETPTAPTEPPRPAPAPCASDADCAALSSYCETCACVPASARAALPPCGGRTVRCLVDPCRGRTAACLDGVCGLR